MSLIRFDNPLNTTYSNKTCGGGYKKNTSRECRVGFLFCLVELPFSNPQNCSLGDHSTPRPLGSNHIDFANLSQREQQLTTYTFPMRHVPLVCIFFSMDWQLSMYSTFTYI